jgi:NodT family efflux transporter outer membrane factor (OMF) lipoprotein
VFNDETLNKLINRAFSGNLDLSQAFSRLEQAESLAKQAGAVRYPNLNIEANASRSRQLINPDNITGKSYGMSLASAFEVDLWNKLKSNYQAREFETKASVEDIRNLYLTLSARVADLYYLMVEQRAQLELTHRTVAARKATEELVERRYLEGMVSALDVYQARQTLAAAQSKQSEFETTLAVTAHALSILVGEYPDPNTGGTLAQLPDVPDLFPAGLPSELLTRRPDIQAQLLRIKARDQEVGAAVADRFPSINLLADYGRSGSDFSDSLSGTVWNLVGNLMLPLIDWGGRKTEVERRKAIFQEQLDQYRQIVLNAFKEVEDALVSNRQTETAIEWLEKEEKAADSALRLALDRYLDGLSDYLPVLTAQALHFDSQNRLLSSRRQLISNRISLARALGGIWMDTDIKKRLNG